MNLDIGWYLKYNTFFAKIKDKQVAIIVFANKSEILKNINYKLNQFWYEFIVEDIRIF